MVQNLGKNNWLRWKFFSSSISMLYLFIKLDHCKVTTAWLFPSQMTAFSVAVQSLSHAGLFATPWIAALQASLSSTVSLSLLKFMSIELVMVSNNLIFCYPLLLLPSIFPSIRVFSNESALHIRQSMYWSFSLTFTKD